jgi:hypothetical protein
MTTLKRGMVWLLERLIEACILGCLFMYLIARIAHNSSDTSKVTGISLASVWVGALVVAVFLFLQGYYLTTAIFGVFWRSQSLWVYPATSVVLFALHTHLIFLRAGSDFTQEARAMERPLIVGGSLIVFACSFAGNEVLKRWTVVQPTSNPYVSASVLTLFSLLLLNVASYLRPIVGSSSFRPVGLPFTFYREGGYVYEWVWRAGAIVWRGLLADLAVAVAVIALTGKAAKHFRMERRSGKNGDTSTEVSEAKT